MGSRIRICWEASPLLTMPERAGHPRLAAGATLDLFCELPQAFLGYGASALDDRIDAELERLGRRRLANVALTSFAQIVDLLVHTDHTAVLPWRIAQMHQARLSVHPVPLALPPDQLFMCLDRRSNADAGVQWLNDALVRIGRASGEHSENSNEIEL